MTTPLRPLRPVSVNAASCLKGIVALNGDVVSGPATSNLSEQFHSFSYISEFASFSLFSLHWCDHIKSFQCLSLALSSLPRRLHQRTQRWSDTGCFTFYWNKCLQIWLEYTHDKETLLYIYTLLTLAWHMLPQDHPACQKLQQHISSHANTFTATPSSTAKRAQRKETGRILLY